ncbi:MAG: hypothetical protein Q8M02_10265 [Candidatus Didemnitutus sp.]|nr:hypothetical protein [Candidatus Didemnitutus sp.]
MSRELPTGMAAALTAPVVRFVTFLEFDFSGGFLRLWSGRGEKSWNDHTWSGVGELLSISPVDETTEIGAAGLQISLSGLPPGIITLALDNNYRGRACRFWLALCDEEWVVQYSLLSFGGRMDVLTIEEGRETSIVTVRAENRLVDLGRPRSLRYTPAEQERLFPGDTSMRYVARLAEKPLPWGAPPTAAPGSGSSYGGGSTGEVLQ